jgi:hypothetical protein
MSRIQVGRDLPAGGIPLVMARARLEKYGEAVAKFEKAFQGFRTDLDRRHLLRIILEACAGAERYIAGGGDEHQRQRKIDDDAIKDLPEQIAAIRAMRAFSRKYQRQAGLALMAAGFTGCGDSDKGKPLNAAFVDMLTRYEKTLADFTRKGGPWMHRVSFANLIFPQSVDTRKKHPTVATGLLFQLVYYLRRFTSGEDQFGAYQTGESMPDCGQPHYEIANAFVLIATGEEILEPGARLRKLIKENPGIGVGGWPT